MINIKPPATRAPRQPDTQTVVIRLQRDEVALADKYSKEETRSRSSFIRLMFLQGIQEYERQHGHTVNPK